MDTKNLGYPNNGILGILRSVFWIGRRNDTWDSSNFEYHKSNVLMELYTKTLDDLINNFIDKLKKI